MGHYAKDYNSATDDGVVDNLMLTPYIGYSYDFAVGGVVHLYHLGRRLDISSRCNAIGVPRMYGVHLWVVSYF